MARQLQTSLRIYREEGLMVRTQKRKKAAATRVPLTAATRQNQRWSMDFVHDRMMDQCWFRVLTVVAQYTRECVLLFADQALSAAKVVAALDRVVAERGRRSRLLSITAASSPVH
jgi:putative transposase